MCVLLKWHAAVASEFLLCPQDVNTQLQDMQGKQPLNLGILDSKLAGQHRKHQDAHRQQQLPNLPRHQTRNSSEGGAQDFAP